MAIKKIGPVGSWNILSYFFVILIFTSCLTAKKVDRWVAGKYKDQPAPRTRKGAENISVNTTLPDMGNSMSSSELKTTRFLPLILYWQFENRTTCQLNPQIAVNNFTNIIKTYHVNATLQKLNGRRLEVTIEKLPRTFVLTDIEHAIWLVYIFAWYKLAVEPGKEGMLVSYKLYDQTNTVVKSGEASTSNMDKGIPIGPFQSVKRKTWEYLDQYNANISTLSKEIIDSIVAEL